MGTLGAGGHEEVEGQTQGVGEGCGGPEGSRCRDDQSSPDPGQGDEADESQTDRRRDMETQTLVQEAHGLGVEQDDQESQDIHGPHGFAERDDDDGEGDGDGEQEGLDPGGRQIGDGRGLHGDDENEDRVVPGHHGEGHGLGLIRCGRYGADPIDSPIRRTAQAVRQLTGVVLEMAQVDELVLEFGHVVPPEAAIGGRQVEAIDGGIDAVVADLPVLEKLPARVGLADSGRVVGWPGKAAEELVLLAVLRPGDEIALVGLQIEMGVVEELRTVADMEICAGLTGPSEIWC